MTVPDVAGRPRSTYSGVRVVLLDIEGTTTPISFVHDVLFPYARARLTDYLNNPAHTSEVADITRRLADEHAEDERRGEQPAPLTVPYLQWLMDRDRKSPALKLLQGLIWERGYQVGELRGLVFDDVPRAIRRWHEAGVRVAIYSSGSELAQRRLFESTAHGNLVPNLSGFFDTKVGAKVSADSYRAIANALNVAPASVLFISDVTRELDAAREAGMQVILSLRPGNAPQQAHDFPVLTSFDDLSL